ncbi:hypothetical protein ACRQ5D_32630 [Mucilaginibacter sp. P25]|uniref:hypothetical protein n=1 Tax=Mucilaginibacter sp. P25 TaxID=3423945 RepID=UPI003D7B452C
MCICFSYYAFRIRKNSRDIPFSDVSTNQEEEKKKINGLSSFAQEKVPGDTVLVEGATGGLGSSSVQLAKLYGVSKVLGAASTPEKERSRRALALMRRWIIRKATGRNR